MADQVPWPTGPTGAWSPCGWDGYNTPEHIRACWACDVLLRRERRRLRRAKWLRSWRRGSTHDE